MGLIQQKIPRFDIVFEPVIANPEELSTRGMNDLDLKVLSCIDGRRTVQEILDILDRGDFEVAKRIFHSSLCQADPETAIAVRPCAVR